MARDAAPAASAYSRRSAGFKRVPRPAGIRNVLVFVSDARRPSPVVSSRAVLAQRGEQFVPPVAGVTVGSLVEFSNDDPLFHNVFSLSGAATFDLGRYPPGESRSHRFTAPGVVKVFCHIRAQMSAIVRVFDHPWFVTPADDHTFVLDAVPPGTHRGGMARAHWRAAGEGGDCRRRDGDSRLHASGARGRTVSG
ncbi:MAG: hypothetical protein ABR606_06390 [Vicinamibacterales bacterium]